MEGEKKTETNNRRTRIEEDKNLIKETKSNKKNTEIGNRMYYLHAQSSCINSSIVLPSLPYSGAHS